MKIKLLYVITSLKYGGAQMGMVRILNNLPKSKYEIRVISITPHNDIEHKIDKNFITVNKLNINSKLRMYKAFIGLFLSIRQFKPHVLVCSLFHATILGRIVGRLAKVPSILNWEHSENLGNSFRRFCNLLTSRLSNCIIVDSFHTYKAIKRYLKDHDRIAVIPIGGLDLKLYLPVIHKEKKQIHIGSVGSLTEQKNFGFLINIAKYLPESCTIEIAGDGPQFYVLTKMIRENGLENRVILRGIIDDIPKFLAKLDIYVQPSLWEGLCITVVEAAASGLPIVAFRVGGILETVEDGYNGFLISLGDLENFKEKVLKLIFDNNLRKVMGDRSRRVSEEKYPLSKMVNKFDYLITNL